MDDKTIPQDQDIEVICPDCWHEFEITEEEADELIICSCCGYEFYEDESVIDD